METKTLVSVLIILAIIGGLGAYRILPRDEVRRFDMDVMEYGYDQIRGGPTLAVSLGDSVEITLTNKGKLTHEFIMIDSETLRTTLKEGAVGRAELQEALDEPLTTVIEGAAILNLEPGETETITFVADKPGRYLFACFRDGPDGVNHVYRQMWGEFSVVPPQP